jgi:glycosyltransferase involved in cell wall biosynthesis
MHRVGTVQRLEDYFDAVAFLTWSNWASEPRSNRYHYATRFARLLPTYFFQPSDNHKITEEESGVPGLTVVNIPRPYDSAQATAFNKYLRAKGVRRPLLWVYNPKFENVLSAHPSWFRVYHATEDYTINETLFIAKEDQETLFRILPNFDLLVAVSDSVRRNYLQRLDLQVASITLPNGCDFDFWRESRACEFEMGADGPNVCLYQGGINRRLDFELLGRLADAMPDWIFAFCGRADKSKGEAERMRPWRALMERANVRYFGELSPVEIAELAKGSSVGIIPFREGEMIRISLPLKAYEYVACGLPVVSVPIKALAEDPSNFCIASTAQEFEAGIRRLAPTRSERQSLDRRMAAAAAMSYDKRFLELEEEVCSRVADLLGREKGRLNILMLHDDDHGHVKTIQEHLDSFATHSRHRYFYLPSSDRPTVGYLRDYGYRWPDAWNFELYDAIVWHVGTTATLPDFSSDVVEQFAAYDGLKVLFVQNEYANTPLIWDRIRKAGIHLVMSRIPEAAIEEASPRDSHKGVEFIQTLTGFVREDQDVVNSRESTDRAYKEIIESGRYSYRKFVEAFDTVIEHRVLRKARAEIFSAPIGYRLTPGDHFRSIVRHSAHEYILTDRPLCTPLERRDLETAIANEWRQETARAKAPVTNRRMLDGAEDPFQRPMSSAEELDRALELARRQVNEVLTSTSWRVTAPMRAVVRWGLGAGHRPRSGESFLEWRENDDAPVNSGNGAIPKDEDLRARQAALQAAQARLAALIHSTSWRVTAPLCWVGRLRGRRLG